MTLGNGQVILLTVGEFAKICQTTIRTIRFYEKAGLIKPVKIDHWNNYRYYSLEQARQIAQIKLLQHFNIPLKEIKKQVNSKKTRFSLRGQLQKLEEDITSRQKELEVLKSINELLFEGDKAEKYIKEELIGPFKLFCLRIEHGDYHKINDYIDQLRGVANSLNISCLNSEIAFFLDDVYKPKQTKIEIALICKKIQKRTQTLPKNYCFKNLPKTKCLVFNYQGPYNYLTAIYNGLDKYIKKNSIFVKGHVFEQYIVNPLDTNSQYNFVTKMCYPI